MEKSLIQKYKNYQVVDFVLDMRFQKWVEGASDPFWEHFIANYPEKQEVIEEAKGMLSNFKFKGDILSPQEKEGQLKLIYDEIERRKVNRKKPGVFRLLNIRYATAASISIVVIFSLVFFGLFDKDYTQFETGNQETNTFRLVDGTEVMLNANSSLKSFASPEKNGPREVWLTGEAFFNVKTLNTSEEARRFIVHTNNLDIQVLGTRFNVKNRDQNTSVFLEEGKVKVGSKISSEQLTIGPGECIEINSNNNNLEKKIEEAEKQLAWQKNQFVFNNTKLKSVAEEMEHYYGKKVVVEAPLNDNIFTATVSRDNMELLLQLISESFSMEIIQEKDTIILKEK